MLEMWCPNSLRTAICFGRGVLFQFPVSSENQACKPSFHHIARRMQEDHYNIEVQTLPLKASDGLRLAIGLFVSRDDCGLCLRTDGTRDIHLIIYITAVRGHSVVNQAEDPDATLPR